MAQSHRGELSRKLFFHGKEANYDQHAGVAFPDNKSLPHVLDQLDTLTVQPSSTPERPMVIIGDGDFKNKISFADIPRDSNLRAARSSVLTGLQRDRERNADQNKTSTPGTLNWQPVKEQKAH
ncbi:hypothetical protein BGZ54_007148 [Gamsiella multidivaricata]|nr:hypothetical protein BGZ54_007148 [Gamsiella multidivaricata]